VEFASFYRSLGTDVTIVEYMDRLVPNEDEDISKELGRAFRKRGIRVKCNHELTRASASAAGVALSLRPRDGGEPIDLSADKLLVAVGIAANVEDLGLAEAGVALERGVIRVNNHLKTSVDNIYAIGDVTGGLALAHVASAEGVFVAELLAGKSPHPIPYDAIPACTYCHPEVASVGMTEAAAREAGYTIRIGKFPFAPLGKTIAAGEYPGFVKLVFREENNALLGAHLIGPAVTDLIAEPTLAKTTEVNAESLFHTVHAHPTFAEALKEAAEQAYDRSIHI